MTHGKGLVEHYMFHWLVGVSCTCPAAQLIARTYNLMSTKRFLQPHVPPVVVQFMAVIEFSILYCLTDNDISVFVCSNEITFEATCFGGVIAMGTENTDYEGLVTSTSLYIKV